jgi:plasmid stabilization system protein ParE
MEFQFKRRASSDFTSIIEITSKWRKVAVKKYSRHLDSFLAEFDDFQFIISTGASLSKLRSAKKDQ